MSLNDDLKELMRAKGLTYQQTADKSGYSLASIRAYMLPITSKARRNVSKRAFELIGRKIK